MAQIINMSREYGCRPSSLLDLDGYAAYCFDEAAFYLLAEAMDDRGKVNWKRIRWRGEKKQGNQELIQFIQSQRGR